MAGTGTGEPVIRLSRSSVGRVAGHRRETTEDLGVTEAEWQTCRNPLPMLIFLRGDVPAEQRGILEPRILTGHGDLFHGPGARISPQQCRRFISACLESLGEPHLDKLSRAAIEAYKRYAEGRGSRNEFAEACSRIHRAASSGATAAVSPLADVFWTDEPAGAARAATEIAWAIANARARDSVAVTCADASDDDWFAWSFCGGPPDPLWQSILAEEGSHQAAVLREIIGNPYAEAADP